MGHRLGKLIHLATLLVKHGEAIEADLARIGVDLLDFYRPTSALTVRRLSVLINHNLLQRGTAVMVSITGERGRWGLLEEMVGGYLGVKPPEEKSVTEWKAANQARIKKIRADRQAELEKQRQLNSG